MNHRYRRRHISAATLVAAVILALLAVVAGSAAAQSQPAGDQVALRKLIADAVTSGAASVRIPPGVYRLGPDPAGTAHLRVKGAHDLEIDARDVTVILTDARTSGIFFQDCRKVRLRGLSVDCDPLMFTQGRVAAIEPQGQWYDLAIDPGYRDDAEAFANPRPMSIFEPGTREYKTGIPDLFLGRIEKTAPGHWRVYPVAGTPGRDRFPVREVRVGDLAAIPFFGPAGLTCRGCADMVFEGVTIYQTGSMAFHEHGGEGGTTLRNCRVMRKPGTTRLLSTNADGYHCKNMRRGPLVEGCLFEGMHDDAINVHTQFSRVLAADGETVWVVPMYEEPSKAGDKIEFFDQATMKSLGIYAIRDIAIDERRSHQPDAYALFPEMGRQPYNGWAYRLRLDQAAPVKYGDSMEALACMGSGFVIRNNTFRTHRYRSILATSSGGLIEDNHIEGCTFDAIALTPGGGQGGFARDIVVRRNTIRHTGMVPWHHAAIRVGLEDGPPRYASRENRDITIEDNLIEDVAGDGIMVSNAANVVVRGNTIEDVGLRRVSARVPAAIEVFAVGGVTIDSNTILATPAESARVAVDPKAAPGDVNVHGNRIEPARR